jgi:hypothetical protein
MSSPILEPGEDHEEFGSTFDLDFPYDQAGWRNNLVLESLDGVRFHFPAKVLIDASEFFAGAPVSTPSDGEQPIPGSGRLQPIPLTFASSESLGYFLIVVREEHHNPATDPALVPSFSDVRRDPSWEILTQALRIANPLDAPGFAVAVLGRSKLDVYQSFAIAEAFEINAPDVATASAARENRHGTDVSFSLEHGEQRRKCVSFIEEFNPRVLKCARRPLDRFERRRKTAILDTVCAMTNPSTRLLMWGCSRRTPRIHSLFCDSRLLTTETLRARMEEVAPIIMQAVSTARTVSDRVPAIRTALYHRVNGCGGCLGYLKIVYMPALMRFQMEFPDGPSRSLSMMMEDGMKDAWIAD